MNNAQLTARAILAALAATAVYSAPALAQQEASASGEVRRVNPAEGKVTITHGAISGLDLPAMSLVYLVTDPVVKASLSELKPGDKVKFTARRENGQYVITAISK